MPEDRPHSEAMVERNRIAAQVDKGTVLKKKTFVIPEDDLTWLNEYGESPQINVRKAIALYRQIALSAEEVNLNEIVATIVNRLPDIQREIKDKDSPRGKV